MDYKDDREPYRLRLRNSIAVLLFIGLGLFGLCQTILYLQAKSCPTGTFLSRALTDGADSVAVFGVMVLIAYIIGPYLQNLKTGLSDKTGAAFRNEPSQWRLIASLVIAGLFVLLYAWLCLSQYCAAPEGLYVRNNPTEPFHRYSWDQVTSIKTACESGTRGTWTTSFKVVMLDGALFNLDDGVSLYQWTPTRHFAAAYPALAKTLHGRPIDFDDSKVKDNCASPKLRMLAVRP